MSRIPIPHGPYDLNARLSAPRRGHPAVVPVECYERERNRAVAAEARIAALEAELAAAKEREAALAAALDIARQEIEACRQDVAGTYAEARFAGVLAELSDPAPILATLRREAKREALRELPGYRFSDTGHDDDGYDLWNAYVDRVRAALAALDAEEKEAQNG